MTIVTVKETEDGELYFEIPEEFIEQLGWSEGMTIEWIDNEDGTWTLQKK
ncbi:AbrB/MazE/SpoVT family DNA-binding domain-containing protein [Photobacterium sagamiensis]